MVEVFSTSVKTKGQADMLLGRLQKAYPAYSINFDLEDCDKILRVAFRSGKIDENGILKIIRDLGFLAQILPDIPGSISK